MSTTSVSIKRTFQLSDGGWFHYEASEERSFDPDKESAEDIRGEIEDAFLTKIAKLKLKLKGKSK